MYLCSVDNIDIIHNRSPCINKFYIVYFTDQSSFRLTSFSYRQFYIYFLQYEKIMNTEEQF